ncbi:unnamed protein product [Didymodactylos carnosus]|uniref:G-protein coupled receptors family 1 profile domain-containing protein n=1 Tax=Didymodactylos carnosus TaxID=1234261 RepID=A0A814RXH5_9BILA|nr:unnamed protein product [Didymodactylos carnosus]CAF1139260.1 unnamed protein product [Didymodactylos carnosus]CAF3703145.1 unnamed protein product [Didymodactylos carnosus]CAF3902967.1 unnamed protein product [Didymodactylos carnosus]
MSDNNLSNCEQVSSNEDFIYYSKICFGLSFPAVVIHIIFWLHISFYHQLRKRSMLWIYNYMLCDLVYLMQFYIEYGTRISSLICHIHSLLRGFLCYLESYTGIYLSSIESYLLVGLNLCRYLHIVRNVNLFHHSQRIWNLLIISMLSLYIIALLSLIFQINILHIGYVHTTSRMMPCHIDLILGIDEYINITLVIIIPVLLNGLFTLLIFLHVRKSRSNIQRCQHKQQILLLIQLFVLYFVWLTLWSPHVIISYRLLEFGDISQYTKICALSRIIIDPLIFILLDKRFYKQWKQTGQCLLRLQQQRRHRRIQPQIQIITNTTNVKQ